MPPDQPNAKPDRPDLEAAIDALLSEIDTTRARSEKPRTGEGQAPAEHARAESASVLPPPPPPSPASPHDEPAGASDSPATGAEAHQAIQDAESAAGDLLEAAADQLIESLEAEVGDARDAPVAKPVPGPAPTPSAAVSAPEAATQPPSDEGPPAEGRDGPPDQTQPQATEPAEPASAAPAPVTASPDAFAALDAAFDELMEGSFESASGEAVDTSGVDTRPDPALMLDRTASAAPAPIPAEPGGDAGREQDAEASGVMVLEPARAPAANPAAASPTVVAPGASGPRKKTHGLPGRLLVWMRTRLAALGAPVGARALVVLSKPLESKPPSVRDSIGWVAIWTLFLGLCVWAFVLLRPAPTPANDGQGTRVVTGQTPAE